MYYAFTTDVFLGNVGIFQKQLPEVFHWLNIANTHFGEYLLMAVSDFLKQVKISGEQLLLYWLFN